MAGSDRRGTKAPRPGRARRGAREPLAAGWLLPNQPAAGEVVVALFGRDDLAGGLAALHRTGRGHLARVLDGARGDLRAQLTRTGVTQELGLPDAELGSDAALVLVNASAQGDAVGDLLLGAGARQVRVVARGTAPAIETPDATAAEAPAPTDG